MHLEDEGFAALLLLVCAVGAKLSPDPRVLADGTDNWHSAGWREKVCVIVWPERWFTSVAEPAVVEVAVTVAVIESPARTLKPVKSEALAGYHSNQAIMVHRAEDLKQIRSGKNGSFD